jgi:hypothetical protein
MAKAWLALAKVGHWPPSRLMVGAAPSTRAQVVVKSTVRILSTSSTCMCGWAAVDACLPTNLLHRCVASCLLLAC